MRPPQNRQAPGRGEARRNCPARHRRSLPHHGTVAMSAGRRTNRMSVTVYIPTPFRRLAGNQVYIRMEGSTVAEVLDNLGNEFPGLRHLIFDESDEVPGHINIYVNNLEMHSLKGKETPLNDGDEAAVIPHIAGGQVLTEEQVNRYSRHIITPRE